MVVEDPAGWGGCSVDISGILGIGGVAVAREGQIWDLPRFVCCPRARRASACEALILGSPGIQRQGGVD